MTQEDKNIEFGIQVDPAIQIQQAVASSDIPKVYANGFICARSNSDVMVILQLNGQPVSMVNLSFTSAKTLANNLRATVEQIEKMMDHKIMTIDEINNRTSKNL